MDVAFFDPLFESKFENRLPLNSGVIVQFSFCPFLQWYYGSFRFVNLNPGILFIEHLSCGVRQ